jgi:hypothetical protein
MRTGHSAAIGVITAWVFAATVCSATSIPLGPPVAIGPGGLAVEMDRNPELANFVARRGYPDWVERVEVDSEPPLDSYEVRVFYLRLDKEIAFTRASILGQPYVGVRKFDRPIPPAMRERIAQYYLAVDPAGRAELAADRAAAAAECAERTAARAADAADRVTRIAEDMDRSFRDRLRK